MSPSLLLALGSWGRGTAAVGLVVVGLPVVGLGCGSSVYLPARYVSTDGQEFVDAYPQTDARLPALQASGAHDLACPADQVRGRILETDRGKPVYVAEGCGRRASYVTARRPPSPGGAVFDCTLTSVVALTPVPTPAPSPVP